MMKIILVLFLLAVSIIQPVAAYGRTDEKKIPEWTKKRLNPGQYRLLEELSHCYETIDYTMFKRRDLDTTGLYFRLSQAVKNGNAEPRAKSCMFLKLDRVLYPYSEESIQCTRKKCIVYSSIEGYDAHVEVEFCYSVDSQGVPSVLYWKVDAKSFSGIPVRYEKQELDPQYDSRFSYKAKRNVFDGYVVGALYFTDAYGKEYKEDVSENFEINVQ